MGSNYPRLPFFSSTMHIPISLQISTHMGSGGGQGGPTIWISPSKAAVLSLWAATTFEGEPEYQIPCISDIYITIHIGNKITVVK